MALKDQLAADFQNDIDGLSMAKQIIALQNSLRVLSDAVAALTAPAVFSMANNVVIIQGAGAPVDGTTGDNVAGPGSLYIDRTSGDLYAQTAVITSPAWVLVSSQ